MCTGVNFTFVIFISVSSHYHSQTSVLYQLMSPNISINILLLISLESLSQNLQNWLGVVDSSGLLCFLFIKLVGLLCNFPIVSAIFWAENFVIHPLVILWGIQLSVAICVSCWASNSKFLLFLNCDFVTVCNTRLFAILLWSYIYSIWYLRQLLLTITISFIYWSMEIGMK